MITKKNIIRLDIAENIHQELGLPVNEFLEIVDLVFDKITEGLLKDGEVKIKNFGTFTVHTKKERIGRNPKTKEEKKISARKVVSFYSAKNLKKVD